jgi:hypothetical protein
MAMTFIFWIIVGAAALLLGLILRARLREEQVWEGLVSPDAPVDAFPSEDQHDRNDERSKPQNKEVNTPIPAPTPTSRSSHVDLRRSSRIERSVPLLILGTNRYGETFQEKTYAVAVNLHGCRYSSRHDYAPESWIRLQVTGTEGANSPVVRARVRSVLSTPTRHDLCQVGIELETPGNVWGIASPPEDWLSLLTNNSAAYAAVAASPVRALSASLSSSSGKQPAPPERKAEVTTFPGPPAAVTHAGEIAPAKELVPTQPARVVITGEQLVQALHGKIQLAAEKAVETSLSTQLGKAVEAAVAKIEEAWRANVRQTEEFSAARLAEVQNLWEKELANYRGRAEEISRRLEVLASNSQQTLAETQKFVERFANETAPQLEVRLNDSLGRANNEFEGRAAQVSEHHLAQFAERAQLAAREARCQVDESVAEVHSLLSSIEEFRRRLEVQIDLFLTEAKERATSSVTPLDAESRAALEARRAPKPMPSKD